mmetsp:Transcript_38656/g.84070  ORF Transcript_38656/g.84070 Transcript_38656/m.84070 type:complete len:297 (-) Transcript_38656:2109-2999(-)|eukprot:CAMPEP_0118923064 /NCGR_PEP_ID=MMETSP1169-20130426/1735_1 /TAXON_ID=36882 /ORGANISM="Pyramimonas obovata, Strain CCMP722" /LENGTH=296 /DNA_ID=CAMNT_0006864005 /DNA_START=103 /DNA_END=993 /DNA_ORIENTATION=-
MDVLRSVLLVAAARWTFRRIFRRGLSDPDDIKRDLSSTFEQIVVDNPRDHDRGESVVAERAVAVGQQIRGDSDNSSLPETSGLDANILQQVGRQHRSRDNLDDKVISTENRATSKGVTRAKVDPKRVEESSSSHRGENGLVPANKKCAVCMNALREVRLSCGHSLTCRKCTVKLQKRNGLIDCPVCRSSVTVVTQPNQNLHPDVLGRTGVWKDGTWLVGSGDRTKDKAIVSESAKFKSLLEASEHWAANNCDDDTGEKVSHSGGLGPELPSDLQNICIKFGNVQTGDFNQTFVPTK